MTVRFSQPAAFVDLRVAEYGGLDAAAPFDAGSSSTGSAATADSGAATTTGAGDLLIGAGITQGAFGAAGAGFTGRIITAPDGDILEDSVAGGPGAYSATAPQSQAGSWVMQIAAFRAVAGTPPPATATPLPTPPGTTGGASYPLKVSADGRYLVDQRNVPFLLIGDSPQALIGDLSEADAASFFADRQAHGFDAVWINLLCDGYTGCNQDGTTRDGLAPFTTPRISPRPTATATLVRRRRAANGTKSAVSHHATPTPVPASSPWHGGYRGHCG